MEIIEEWKDIKDYEGLYQVSNLGRVRSLDHKCIDGRCIRSKILKGGAFSNEYKFICLRKNGENKNHLLHRLIAKAFISNNENKPIVNHLDGNKLNNSIENLEWCTQSENRLHANTLGLSPQRGKPRSVNIEKGGVVRKFETLAECSSFFGFKKCWINARIRTKGLTFYHNGYLIKVSERG